MNAIAVFNEHGAVKFEQMENNHCLLTFHLTNFKPFSTHAIHIHEFGDTTGGCSTLGGHYNPDNKNHGNLLSTQRHVGDLINNFTTNEQGNFSLQFYQSRLKVENIFGRSVVIHELADDLGLGSLYGIPYHCMTNNMLYALCAERGYKGLTTKSDRIAKLEKESLITGNAGKRLACAVIGRMK